MIRMLGCVQQDRGAQVAIGLGEGAERVIDQIVFRLAGASATRRQRQACQVRDLQTAFDCLGGREAGLEQFGDDDRAGPEEHAGDESEQDRQGQVREALPSLAGFREDTSVGLLDARVARALLRLVEQGLIDGAVGVGGPLELGEADLRAVVTGQGALGRPLAGGQGADALLGDINVGLLAGDDAVDLVADALLRLVERALGREHLRVPFGVARLELRQGLALLGFLRA